VSWPGFIALNGVRLDGAEEEKAAKWSRPSIGRYVKSHRGPAAGVTAQMRGLLNSSACRRLNWVIPPRLVENLACEADSRIPRSGVTREAELAQILDSNGDPGAIRGDATLRYLYRALLESVQVGFGELDLGDKKLMVTRLTSTPSRSDMLANPGRIHRERRTKRWPQDRRVNSPKPDIRATAPQFTEAR